jgi:hypothetical protein
LPVGHPWFACYPRFARAFEGSLYDAIKNIGVACVIFKWRSSVTPHFWGNITDKRIDIPGIVESSNLRPIVFGRYYMPVTHPKWTCNDQQLLAEAFGYLKLINPELTDADLIDSRVGRLPGFGLAIPPVHADRWPSDCGHVFLLP